MRLATVFAVVCSLTAGTMLTLLACEALLRLLPVQNGLFAADPSSDWPVHHLMAHSRYTFSDAWDLRNVHHGATNGLGYVAPFEYLPASAGIVVVGDSFVEGVVNEYADTLQGQLAQRLTDAPPVLNFGTSGASLSDYIGLGPMVSKSFRVQWVVILVVSGDFTDAFTPQPGFFVWSPDRTPPVRLIPQTATDPATKFLRTLAVVRYAKGNLKLSLSHLLHTSVTVAARPCVPAVLQPGDTRLIESYADSLPAAYGVAAAHVILIFDADRQELYRSNGARASEACPTRDGLARQLLARQAAAHGERAIDMAPIFAAYFRATHQRVDYSPIDWHWNVVGNRLAASEVARVVNGEAAEPPQRDPSGLPEEMN